MNDRRPIEERITLWLEQEAPDDVPNFVLESAFARTQSLPQERPSFAPPRLRLFVPSRRVVLLLAAALLGVALIGAAFVGGAVRRPTNLLNEIQQEDRIRIAVRPDHPQAAIGSVAEGFDIDVGNELASRLGVRNDLVIVDEQTMLAPGAPAWDVALPSTAGWRIDAGSFQQSISYYDWPHRLIVPAGSTANALQDVAAGPICAVAGDPSEEWLRGGYGGAKSSPAAMSVITRQTDADCLSALASGDAVAAVTAWLSDADLHVLADLRVIGGPDAELRTVVVHRSSATAADPNDLLSAVDDALVSMRTDGTLKRLSQSRFGGADLTTP